MADAFDWMAEDGLAALGKGVEGFARGWQDAEDRKMKQLEMNSKMEAQKAERERQRFMDKMTAREKGLDVKPGQDIYSQDPAEMGYREDYLNLQREKANMAAAADPYGAKRLAAQNAVLENQKKRQDLAKGAKDAEQAAKGFKLPPDKVLQVQQGSQIPTILGDIEKTLDVNKDLFGPVQGRIGSANPYNEKAQTVDAQFRTASQTFGRYMEGGVLRKEDEDKYRKMFPQLSDTPAVAANKLAIVRKMLVDKQNADVMALKDQGYDTAGFKFLPPAENPGLLTGKGLIKGGGLIDQALPKAVADDVPKPGTVQDGYQFLGGDPADKKNWKKVK